MSDTRTLVGENTAAGAGSALFGGSAPERGGGLSPAVWGIAALVVAVVVLVLVLANRKAAPPPTTLQPEDAYAAAALRLTSPAMSESESVSGVKVTYLDGRVQNTGTKTVTAITVQVVFGNDEQLPPAIQTVPLTLIRTRQPYIDTEPVSAEPIKAGDDREFRLIFESVPQNWNQQMPQVRVIHTEVR